MLCSIIFIPSLLEITQYFDPTLLHIETEMQNIIKTIMIWSCYSIITSQLDHLWCCEHHLIFSEGPAGSWRVQEEFRRPKLDGLNLSSFPWLIYQSMIISQSYPKRKQKMVNSQCMCFDSKMKVCCIIQLSTNKIFSFKKSFYDTIYID